MVPGPKATAQWAALVNALDGRLPRLAAEFVAEVQGIGEYSDVLVPEEELHEAALSSLQLVIDALGDRKQHEQMQAFASKLGSRRATQGISAEALMSAVRLNFPIIWRMLLEIATEDEKIILANSAAEVWRVVDDHALAVYSSFLETRVHMARQEANVQHEFVSALFGAQGRRAEVRERFAQAFGVDSQATFVLAAATGPAAEEFRRLGGGQINKTPRLFQYEDGSYAVLFWQQRESVVLDELACLPDGIREVPCGLVVCPTGLHGLPDALELAKSLSDVAQNGDPGPITLEKHWPRLARSRLQSDGVELKTSIDLGLSAARPGEADRLREAVKHFLTTGSVQATAQELFTHRNTVLNRIRRFTELTGVDPNVPEQSALLIVAWS